MNKITVIVTVWKRNHLEEQLCALFAQTIQPTVVWVQQTQQHVDVNDVLTKYKGKIHYTYQEENRGVFGRFESVSEVKTPYTYIIDDDIIPGPDFLRNALEACERLNAIISPNGRLITPSNNRNGFYIGDGDEFQHSFCKTDTEVDFGNNAWFFKTEWIRFFLSTSPLFQNNGEDIHLSATLKLKGGIPTYVPQQIIPYESGNTKRCYSSDPFALHRSPLFIDERVKIIDYFRKEKWILMLEQEQKYMSCENPEISIIVVIEDIKTQEKAIKKVLKESLTNYERILVCNKRNEGMFLNNKNIRWVNVKQELSRITMLNIACGLAQGSYLYIINEIGKITTSLSRLKSQYNYLEKQKNKIAVCIFPSMQKLATISLFVRHDPLSQIKYYREEYDSDAELDLLMRLSQKGEIIYMQELSNK